MDTGNVRHWPRMTREQLAKVFPDGRTLHIPSDGHPLPGYALALADQERGSTDRLINHPRPRNVLASLFRSAPDNEEVADQASLPLQVTASPRGTAAPDRTVTQAKAVPLPQRRPTFQVASYEPQPAAAPKLNINFAPLNANDVITLRGYWQGPQDTPQLASFEPAPETTASVQAAKDRVPPDVALAYMSQHDVGSPMVALAEPPEPAALTRGINLSTAQKPARSNRLPPRPNDPWLRGVILAPRLENAMTITTFGAPDFATLAPYLHKPDSAVMMTFSADPHLGMKTDRFTGAAVVFQATVSFGMRTAALQQQR
jgi:hypothetical protein